MSTKYEYVNRYEIERLHRGYFFSPDSMRFFKSRIGEYGYQTDKHIYFVTSEKHNYESKRLYTIRRLDKKSGSIDTFGEFQGYNSSTTANNTIKRLLKAGTI